MLEELLALNASDELLALPVADELLVVAGHSGTRCDASLLFYQASFAYLCSLLRWLQSRRRCAAAGIASAATGGTTVTAMSSGSAATKPCNVAAQVIVASAKRCRKPDGTAAKVT